MNIHTIPLGAYQANCYIVSQNHRCILIDPGADARKILAYLAENGLQPEAILLTHGHFDHVGAVLDVIRATGCTLWMHRADHLFADEGSQMFPLAGCTVPQVRYLEEASPIHLAGMDISVLETPGHTYGSVCILMEDVMFSGDTLFSGSIGRIDLEGGDMHRMMGTLQKLKNLAGSYTVYPGHGPSTTLDREKRVNPFF